MAPNSNVYEAVTFRAADVKDLKIDDPHPNREQHFNQQQQAFVDPAILGVSSQTSACDRPRPHPTI